MEACRHDLHVWLQFLRDFNSRTFFLGEPWQVSPPLKLYTDAAGSKGYGSIFWEALVLGRMACQLEIIEHCIFGALSNYYLAPCVGMSNEQPMCRSVY